jgi:hypothetical protein
MSCDLLAPDFPEFKNQIGSPRRTSKARDFILAIMPQYEFYSIPTNARCRSFSDLWHDCFMQLRAETRDSRLGPLFPAGKSAFWFGSIPTPVTLGDFSKLFLGVPPQKLPILRGIPTAAFVQNEAGFCYTTLAGSQSSPKPAAIPVRIQAATGFDAVDTMRFVQDCIRQSSDLWSRSCSEELAEYQTMVKGPLEALRRHHWGDPGPSVDVLTGIGLLNVLYNNSQHDSLIAPLEMVEHVNMNTVIRLAALICCGVGVNAFGWSLRHLAPVLVEFRGKLILTLVPYSVTNEQEDHEFVVTQANVYWSARIRYTLAVNKKRHNYTTCLFPPDIVFNTKRFRF